MKIAIMQPYIFPYIGYFQLISSVDKFIIYDNIQYTKKGWINRNRFLQDGKDEIFTIPLKKDSNFLDVNKREISTDFNKSKLINKVKAAYRNSPYFENVFPLFEKVVLNNEINLFEYIYSSLIETCKYLEIKTDFIKSTDIDIDHLLKAEDKVIAICNNLGANTYINAIGGQALYRREEFSKYGIDLKFIKSNDISYKQFNDEFVPWLSIIDVMMFNSPKEIKEMLYNFQLI